MDQLVQALVEKVIRGAIAHPGIAGYVGGIVTGMLIERASTKLLKKRDE